MKKTAFLFLLLVSLRAFCQDFQISDTASIDASYGTFHPQIEMNGLNEAVVLWTNVSNNSLNFARYANGTVTSPIQLNPLGLEVQSYNWSGPDLAVEGASIYVVFKQEGYETGHIYMVKSTDNGLTFGDTLRVDMLAEGYAQYPDVAVDGQNVYVTFMKHDAMGMDPQYVVTKSTDGGMTFGQEVPAGALIGDEACDCCQPELIVKGSEVVVFLRNNANNIRDIYAVISHDGGQTFNEFANVDQHNWNINACPSTGPDARFVTSDLFVSCFKSVENNSGKVFLSKNSLSSLGTHESVSVSVGVNTGANYPQMTVADDTIGLVFEGINPGTNTDIFFTYGKNISTSLNVEPLQNLTGVSGIQSKPDIAYRNGKFYVVYADQTNLKLLELSKNLNLGEESVPKKENLVLVLTKEEAQIKMEGEFEIINFAGQKIPASNLEYGFFFLKEGQSVKRLIIIP